MIWLPRIIVGLGLSLIAIIIATSVMLIVGTKRDRERRQLDNGERD